MGASSDPYPEPAPWIICLDLQHDRPVRAKADDLPRRIAACRRLIAHARGLGWPLIHVLQAAVRGTGAPRARAAPPIEGLQPRPFETVILRSGLSAFSDQTFQALIKGAAGREIVLVSVLLGPAWLTTVLDAHDRGVRVTLVEDTLSAGALRRFSAETVRGVLLAFAGPFVRRTTSGRLIRPPAEPRPAANDS